NTIVPSFLSQRTTPDQQGSVLGLTQSVSSIARVPGPVIGGLIYDLGGILSPFLTSAVMLLGSVILGCKTFHACRLERIRR
ncbi:MAG: hypothetical protein ACFFCW_30060, partial [Candidatus Hodarchaeota archaeon]